MFGKKRPPLSNVNFFAQAAQISALDYLAASVLPGSASDRAAFLVLAHHQITAAMVTLIVANTFGDPLPSSELDTVRWLEERLRREIAQLVEKSIATSDPKVFPSDELLRQMIEVGVREGGGARSVKLGADTCWATPTANAVQSKT